VADDVQNIKEVVGDMQDKIDFFWNAQKSNKIEERQRMF